MWSDSLGPNGVRKNGPLCLLLTVWSAHGSSSPRPTCSHLSPPYISSAQVLLRARLLARIIFRIWSVMYGLYAYCRHALTQPQCQAWPIHYLATRTCRISPPPPETGTHAWQTTQPHWCLRAICEKFGYRDWPTTYILGWASMWNTHWTHQEFMQSLCHLCHLFTLTILFISFLPLSFLAGPVLGHSTKGLEVLQQDRGPFRKNSTSPAILPARSY